MLLVQHKNDLEYSVGMVIRFMERPKASHLVALKRILRYVKGSIGCRIMSSITIKGITCKLLGYNDSNWCGYKYETKSIAGFIFMYGETPISLSSKKKLVVELSSCEAEYIVMLLCVCQVVWLMYLVKELYS